jgi:hypothetical protein
MSKRLDRLNAWCEANPYRIYGDYRDTISDNQAAMLLEGDFESFDESFWQWEQSCNDAHYRDWMDEFACEAGYENHHAMPNKLSAFASERFIIDMSDAIQTAIRNYNGMVVATLKQSNGNLIEFPHPDSCPRENSTNAMYLARWCGIEASKAEPTYSGTYLKACGNVDLLAIYKSGKAPLRVYVTPQTFTIGHESFNGSGTCGLDQYTALARWFPATFKIDALDRYGIDSVFGLTSVWRSELKVQS